MGGPFFHLADFCEILIFLFVFLGHQLAQLLLPRPPCIRHAKEEAEAEEEASDATGRGKIIRQSSKTLWLKKPLLCHNAAQHLPQSQLTSHLARGAPWAMVAGSAATGLFDSVNRLLNQGHGAPWFKAILKGSIQ